MTFARSRPFRLTAVVCALLLATSSCTSNHSHGGPTATSGTSGAPASPSAAASGSTSTAPVVISAQRYHAEINVTARVGAVLRTADYAGLSIPSGALTRDGVASIDSTDGVVYEMHINVPWSGPVGVQLPTGTLSAGQVPLLLHFVNSQWTVTDATVNNGIASTTATSLSPWTLVKCVMSSGWSGAVECMVKAGIKALPMKIAQKIFGKVLDHILTMCGMVNDFLMLDSCKLGDGSLPQGPLPTAGNGGGSPGGPIQGGAPSPPIQGGTPGQPIQGGSTTSPAPTPAAPAPVPAGSGRILISPCLNLRAGPNGSTALLDCIPKDTIIGIDCTTQGNSVSGPYGATTLWDHTSWNGKGGYVSDAWVYTGKSAAVAGPCAAPPPPPPTSPAGSGRILISPCLNLRAGPNGSTALLDCIPKDTIIGIDCTTQGNSVSGPYGATTLWDHTSWNGKAGYVSDAWVYTGQSAAVAPAC